MGKFIVIQEDLSESYGPFLNEDSAYNCARRVRGIIFPLNGGKQNLLESPEQITKTEIKEIIKTEIEKYMNSSNAKEVIRSLIESEFKKIIKKSDIQDEMFDSIKDFTKKFYRELALNATYVIDRVR